MKRKYILLLIPFVITLLVGGLWTALERLGWYLPGWPGSSLQHGFLMIVGFLGALISLERAVALQRRWTFSGPITIGAGTLLSVFPSLHFPGYSLIVFGSVINVLTMIYLTRKQNFLFNQIMLLAAVTFLQGNIFWAAGAPIPQIIFYWAGFLLLTIFGERIELTRMIPTKKSQIRLVTVLLLAYFLVTTFSWLWIEVAARIIGVLLIFIALWFFRNDIARRTVKMGGQAKFTAIGLLLGYFWSIVSGLVLLFKGYMSAGFVYDAFTHSLFLGFVFSMIFVHAPIIFPAIFEFPMAFTKRFYSHLYLLQITLLGRIISDLAGSNDGRLWFGLFNVIVILIFIGNTVSSIFYSSEKS
jgi:hypothetical protein